MATIPFLSRSPGLLNREPGGPASLGAGFLYRILSPIDLICNSSIGGLRAHSAGCWLSLPFLSPTDWTSCAPSYIIVRRPPSSCGRHKSHSFNPSTVKVIFWYSSTGCTCYLHRCISYFDSPVGSEVNIQHYDNVELENHYVPVVNDFFTSTGVYITTLSNSNVDDHPSVQLKFYYFWPEFNQTLKSC